MNNNYRVYIGFTTDTDQNINSLALGVIDSLTGHAVFTDPPVTVAQLTTLQTDFSDKLIATRNKGIDRTRAKNAAKTALSDALVQDALYVQGKARHDLDALLSSGYDVCSTNRSRTPLDKPVIHAITNGVSGQLVVRASAVLNAHAYQAQDSTDGGKTWTDLGDFTGARRIALTGLTPGTVYTVRLRAVGGSTGYSEWSEPISHMAT